MDELIKFIIKGAADIGYSMSQRGYRKTEIDHVEIMDAYIDQYAKDATESVNAIITAILKQRVSEKAE